MPKIDEASLIETNKTLEAKFNEERNSWTTKLKDLFSSIKNITNLENTQVYALSYYQDCIELIAQYKNAYDKQYLKLNKLNTEAFRKYTLSYDIKLNSAEKQQFIGSENIALSNQCSLIKTHIDYLSEVMNNLKNCQYSIKNRIELEKLKLGIV